jgi:hypothetical protein
MQKTPFRMIGVIAGVLFACHLSAGTVRADAILTSDNRYVNTNGSWNYNPFGGSPSSGTWNLNGSPSSPFASFNSKVTAPGFDVFAEQISTVTSNYFEALGTAHIKATLNVANCSSAGCSVSGSAVSIFEVGFTLLEAHSFELSTLGQVGQIYLEQVGVGKIVTAPHSYTSVLTTGILGPGSYILRAEHIGAFALVNGESFNNCCLLYPPETPDPNYYHVSMRLQSSQAVPEPSVIVAFGLSLICLAGIVKRRNSRMAIPAVTLEREQRPVKITER